MFRTGSLLKSSDFLETEDHKKFALSPFQKFEQNNIENGGIKMNLKTNLNLNMPGCEVKDKSCLENTFSQKKLFLDVLGKTVLSEKEQILEESNDQTKPGKASLKRVKTHFENSHSDENVEAFKKRIEVLEKINSKLLAICAEMD